MSIAGLMRESMTLQRESVSLDDAGGQSASFAAVSGATDIRCSLQPASGSVQMMYGQRGLMTTHSVFVAKNIGAKAGDRVLLGGTTYAVTGFVENSAGRNKVWRLDVYDISNF